MSGAPPSKGLAHTTVLVTGATGFTGQHLVRRLVQEGATVRAIARSSSDRSGLKDVPVEWLIGEIHDKAVIREAMRGVEVVFHLATLYRTGGATEEEHRAVHVSSTRRLAEAAREQPAFKRFVQVSTVGVHGHIENPPANEETPFSPGDEYQRTKAEAEIWIQEYALVTGLPCVVVRPAAIYGPGDDRLLKVFRMARHRLAPILGRRPCAYHLIHVDDLVELLCLTAIHPDAVGEAFIAGNPEPIALDAMLRVIGSALGQTPRVIRLPVAPFWCAAVACEAVWPRLRIAPPLYRRRIKFFLNDRSFDTRKIRARLGFACRWSNEEGLVDTARWYRANGRL